MNQAVSTSQAQSVSNAGENNQPGTINAPNSPVFPSGLKASDYIGSKLWSNRRWAWEFLRRNTKFQTFCNAVESGQFSRKEIKTKLVESFGLLKFKHYRDNYQPSRPSFSSAQVSVWSDTECKPYSERKTLKIVLAPGEIIFRASLRDGLHPKKRKALLDSMDQLLKQKADDWGESNNKKPSLSTQRGELLPLVRILDLVSYIETLPKAQRITRTQIFAMLYPSLAWTPVGQPYSPGQFDKPFNERWKVARRYTTIEWYLDLAATQ